MSRADLRVVLVGATGRTGNAVAHALASGDHAGVQLVSCVAPSIGSGRPSRALPDGIEAVADLASVRAEADVLVDLATADGLQERLAQARARKLHAVVGTTGVADDLLVTQGEQFALAGLTVRVVPNFALGAVLMLRFAAAAARLLPDVAIVENHHAGKLDAPSGTARQTAQVIADARGNATATATMATSDAASLAASPAFGTEIAGVPVHSLRMAGAMAHQDVVFGAPGEMLTIRHDALDRSCYAGGVVLAVRNVAKTPPGLTTGLDDLL